MIIVIARISEGNSRAIQFADRWIALESLRDSGDDDYV